MIEGITRDTVDIPVGGAEGFSESIRTRPASTFNDFLPDTSII